MVITEINLEAYETKEEGFAFVVVRTGEEAIKETGFEDQFDAFKAGFDKSFEGLDMKDFTVAHFRGNPNKKNYFRTRNFK